MNQAERARMFEELFQSHRAPALFNFPFANAIITAAPLLALRSGCLEGVLKTMAEDHV